MPVLLALGLYLFTEVLVSTEFILGCPWEYGLYAWLFVLVLFPICWGGDCRLFLLLFSEVYEDFITIGWDWTCKVLLLVVMMLVVVPFVML